MKNNFNKLNMKNRILLYLIFLIIIGCNSNHKDNVENLPVEQIEFVSNFSKFQDDGGNSLVKEKNEKELEIFVNNTFANNWIGKITEIDENFPTGYFVEFILLNSVFVPRFTIRINDKEEAMKLRANQIIIFNGNLHLGYDQISVKNANFKIK